MTDHRRHVHIIFAHGDGRCIRCGQAPPTCGTFRWTARTTVRCADCGHRRDEHPLAEARPDDPFTKYLAEACDQEGCDRTATHNGVQRGTAGLKRGQWCNEHTSWEHPAFARND